MESSFHYKICHSVMGTCAEMGRHIAFASDVVVPKGLLLWAARLVPTRMGNFFDHCAAKPSSIIKQPCALVVAAVLSKT